MATGVTARELSRHREKHPKASAKKKEVSEMRIKRAEGGYTVDHHSDGGGDHYEPPETHVIKSSAQLKKHVAQYMCDGHSQESAEEED